MYHFLLILEAHLEALIVEEDTTGIFEPGRYLPLSKLQSVCSEEWFIRYFVPEAGPDSKIRPAVSGQAY